MCGLGVVWGIGQVFFEHLLSSFCEVSGEHNACDDSYGVEDPVPGSGEAR